MRRSKEGEGGRPEGAENQLRKVYMGGWWLVVWRELPRGSWFNWGFFIKNLYHNHQLNPTFSIYQNKSPKSFAIVNLWQFWKDTLLRSVLHTVREKTWYCYKSLFNYLIFHNFKKVDIKITNNLELTLPSARNIFPMKKIIFSAGLMRMMLLVFRDRIFSCIVRSPFKDSSGL